MKTKEDVKQIVSDLKEQFKNKFGQEATMKDLTSYFIRAKEKFIGEWTDKNIESQNLDWEDLLVFQEYLMDLKLEKEFEAVRTVAIPELLKARENKDLSNQASLTQRLLVFIEQNYDTISKELKEEIVAAIGEKVELTDEGHVRVVPRKERKSKKAK